MNFYRVLIYFFSGFRSLKKELINLWRDYKRRVLKCVNLNSLGFYLHPYLLFYYLYKKSVQQNNVRISGRIT